MNQDFQTLLELVNDSNNKPSKEEVSQMFKELEKLVAKDSEGV